MCKSCRSRKMLKNASFLAIVAVHTAENGPSENLQIFENLPNFANCVEQLAARAALRGRGRGRGAAARRARGPDWQLFVVANFGRSLDGSFSAVSTPNFATKASFFSIFRDLQDLQSFAPLRSPKFSKKLQKFCRFSNGSNGSIVRRSNLST